MTKKVPSQDQGRDLDQTVEAEDHIRGPGE